MKKSSLYLLLFLLSMSLFCCSQEKPEEGKILSRINDYNLTLDEFQYQLAAELELDKDFKLTNKAKKEFLEQLIRKELLIQEAKKLELDRKDKFVRAIERYWESTLIRDLMDLKCQEIDKKTYLSREEIEIGYKTMQESGEGLPPLEEVREMVSRELKEKKKTRMLEEWITDLRKNAKIEIAEELL